MLRHIISVSLAMTACASLIPTKANAITLTLEPYAGLQRNPGEIVDFVIKVNPSGLGRVDEVEIRNIVYDFDQTELSLVPDRRPEMIEFGRPFSVSSVSRVIAYLYFKVDRPVKDRQGDVWATVSYRENRGSIIPHYLSGHSSLDVQPVPEPLTMLGAAAALGYGAILKRKYSKKTVS
jgi:hypothetical protein